VHAGVPGYALYCEISKNVVSQSGHCAVDCTTQQAGFKFWWRQRPDQLVAGRAHSTR
jgi:hypothetical protein